MQRIRVTISDLMYDQRSRSIPAPGILFSGGGTSNSEIRRNASKCQGKWPDQTPRPSVRLTRGVGSGQHLASVSQEGRENANIDAGLGFIWRTLVKGPCVRSTSRHGVGRSRVLRLSAEILREMAAEGRSCSQRVPDSFTFGLRPHSMLLAKGGEQS